MEVRKREKPNKEVKEIITDRKQCGFQILKKLF